MSDRYAHLPRAREAAQASFAHRAADDPVQLAKAARIVRAALTRQKIALDELTEPLPRPVSVADRRRAQAGDEVAA